jgi:hypothetical protein
MGVSYRSKPDRAYINPDAVADCDQDTEDEVPGAQAQEQKYPPTRPPTRPRPPPYADNKHTAPLWSEHLQTYVSYNLQDCNWKRWSTTAKIWKVVPDISMQPASYILSKPDGPEWSDPLWLQPLGLLMSYNSVASTWKQYDPDREFWKDGRENGLTEMPVLSFRAECRKDKHIREVKDTEPTVIEDNKSQETTTKSSPAATTLQALSLEDAVVVTDLKPQLAPQVSKVIWKSWVKLLVHPKFNQQSAVATPKSD